MAVLAGSGPRLDGVHASVASAVRRRRRRRAQVDVWEAVDAAIDPAKYRPALHPQLEYRPMRHRSGEQVTMVKTPIGPEYKMLTAEDVEIMSLIDGVRTVREVVVEHFRRTGSFAVSGVAELVEELRRDGFLAERYDPLTTRAHEAHRLHRLHVPTWAWTFARTRRIESRNAHKLFETVYSRGGWVFYTRSFLVLGLLLAIVGAGAFGHLVVDGRYELISSAVAGVAILYAIDLFSTAIHEFGHALTCIHAKRRVNGAGFMLYLGTPAFFIDTTDMWMASRRQRMASAAAGPFSEMVMAGTASILAVALPPSGLSAFLYRFAVLSYVAIAQNLIPFLRLDGYYVLMDALEEVNLREKAFEFVRKDLFAKIREREPWNRDERLLGGYGIVALFFTALAMVFSIGFWSHIFRSAIDAAWREGWAARVFVLFLLVLLAAPLVRGAIGALRALTRRIARVTSFARRTLERSWRADAQRLLHQLPLLEELPTDAADDLARLVTLRTFRAGEVVMREGELGDAFHVVRSGAFEVTRHSAGGTRLALLGRGRAFGELALLNGTPRAATVRCIEPGETIVVGKGPFERVLAGRLEVEHDLREVAREAVVLRSLPLFASLSDDALATVARDASWRTFAPGRRIVTQGQPASSFFVVASGQVDVIRDRKRIRRLGNGAYFGEVALLTDGIRTATVRAATPTRVVEIDRPAFDAVLGSAFRRGRHTPARDLARDWQH